jgi:hypothetical protein
MVRGYRFRKALPTCTNGQLRYRDVAPAHFHLVCSASNPTSGANTHFSAVECGGLVYPKDEGPPLSRSWRSSCVLVYPPQVVA